MSRQVYIPDLSPRQRQVLTLVAEGLQFWEIGAQLGVTTYTAKSHAARAYQALGARNGAQAVHLAYQIGLLSVGEPS